METEIKQSHLKKEQYEKNENGHNMPSYGFTL